MPYKPKFAYHALAAKVREGVLHIPLERNRVEQGLLVELVSPEIGYDARLFDRVEVRVRLVHDRLQPGNIVVRWTTPRNRLFPGWDPWFHRHRSEEEVRQAREGEKRGYDHFANWREGSVIYEPEWQELVVEGLDHRVALSGEGVPDEDLPLSWQGDLVDVRLNFALTDFTQEQSGETGSFPRALEIDRIALRGEVGIGQQTLVLPEAEPAEFFGEWLGEGRFYPLDQRGLEWPVLGDLDGDGKGDLVVGAGLHTRVFLNAGEGSLREMVVWENERFVGLGDVDGDGDEDVVTALYGYGDEGALNGCSARLRRNDGGGRFAAKELSSPEGNGWLPFVLGDFDGNGRVEMVWLKKEERGTEIRVLVGEGYDGKGWRKKTEIAFEEAPETRKYYLPWEPVRFGRDWAVSPGRRTGNGSPSSKAGSKDLK